MLLQGMAQTEAPPLSSGVLVNQMFELIFESFEEAEHFRQYLKEYTGIELPQAHERTDESFTHYEFESYGYPGFVMTMVHRICYNDGIDYTEMRRLPQTRKEKYLENQLFSHAISDVKVWRPPSLRSREFRWVSENLGLSENCIRNVVQRAEKRYYRWLKMERRYSLLIGLIFLVVGMFFASRGGPTYWPALLFFSFAALLLVFCTAKVFQNRKKNRSKLPR